MEEPTVRDVLTFHKIDRALYEKLLFLKHSQEVARKVIVIWMWLENIGNDVVKTITDCYDNNKSILGFFKEAESILSVLTREEDAPPPPEHGNDIPLTASLVTTETLNLHYFYCYRDHVMNWIMYLLDNIGRLIFDNELVALFRVYEDYSRKVAAGEKPSFYGALQGRGYGPEMPPQLSRPFNTMILPPREDSRSLFIIFSMGFPLTEEDILEYFSGRGVRVESVTMERMPPGLSPMYGRIVFTSQSFVGLVLNGEKMVKFVIKGKYMWARKYVSRNH